LIWFWIGFFALVALLLFIDLGLLHKENKEETFKSAVGWTVAWVTLGLSFSGVVYLIYGNHWLGATMVVNGATATGLDAAMVYLSAYLLEEALSIDNIFVMSLLFTSFRIPTKYQHRVLFWGILGAIFFRVAMLGGGAWLVKQFTWIFYVFGAYLVWQGLKLFKGEDEGDDEEGRSHMERSLAVRILRRVVRVVDGDHGGKFLVKDSHGHNALTTLAVCLFVVELTDVVFALDSIPAVLAVSQETFIMVTSNIFAILGLRSLYFVLAGAMAKFQYLKIALAILLVMIGAKMIAHDVYKMPHWLSLVLIAGIIAGGVIASIVASSSDDDSSSGATPTPA
jgi:tellurite resistance protein TerC